MSLFFQSPPRRVIINTDYTDKKSLPALTDNLVTIQDLYLNSGAKLRFPFFHDFIIKEPEDVYSLFTKEETYLENLNKETFYKIFVLIFQEYFIFSSHVSNYWPIQS